MDHCTQRGGNQQNVPHSPTSLHATISDDNQRYTKPHVIHPTIPPGGTRPPLLPTPLPSVYPSPPYPYPFPVKHPHLHVGSERYLRSNIEPPTAQPPGSRPPLLPTPTPMCPPFPTLPYSPLNGHT